MTRYWYDTEFLENGSTIELISIGIVADDGREYYAVNANAPWDRISQHEWLTANVVPQLGPPGQEKPRKVIRAEVKAFLFGGDSPPELWAWFAAYDHVVLAQLFGTMMDFPDGLPMWTNDLRQWQHQLQPLAMPEQPDGLHNALADARFNRFRWNHLNSVERLKARP